jgi:hypothetical protein
MFDVYVIMIIDIYDICLSSHIFRIYLYVYIYTYI